MFRTACFTLLAFVSAALLQALPVSAGEDGLDLFLDAVEAQLGDGGIVSGSGSYNITLTPGPRSEEEIQAEIDREIAMLKEDAEANPAVREAVEAAIENVPRDIRAKCTVVRRFYGSFRFDYSEKNTEYVEKAFSEYFVKEDSALADLPERETVMIQKRDLGGERPSAEKAVYEMKASQVTVDDIPAAAEDFRTFGRIRSSTADLVRSLYAREGGGAAREKVKAQLTEVFGGMRIGDADVKMFEVVETKPFMDFGEAKTLESRIGGKIVQRNVIVPNLGYISPLTQYYDYETGNLTEEYTAKDFVMIGSTGLYWPMVCTEAKYDRVTGNLIEKKSYHFQQLSLKLNQEMSPEDFSVGFRRGTIVLDGRGGKNDLFVAYKTGDLSLAPGGLDLEKKSWLRKHQPGEELVLPKPEKAPGKEIHWLKWLRAFGVWLRVFGFGLIGAGIGLMIYKKLRAGARKQTPEQ